MYKEYREVISKGYGFYFMDEEILVGNVFFICFLIMKFYLCCVVILKLLFELSEYKKNL